MIFLLFHGHNFLKMSEAPLKNITFAQVLNKWKTLSFYLTCSFSALLIQAWFNVPLIMTSLISGLFLGLSFQTFLRITKIDFSLWGLLSFVLAWIGVVNLVFPSELIFSMNMSFNWATQPSLFYVLELLLIPGLFIYFLIRPHKNFIARG